MLFGDLSVTVPRLPRSVPNLHKPNTFFEKTARDQHLPALQSVAVHLADIRGLLVQIENIRRLHLHAVSQLE